MTYHAPPPPMPNALIAKMGRECGRHIVRHADPDRARAAAIDACIRVIDISIRDERDRLAGMVDEARRMGL